MRKFIIQIYFTLIPLFGYVESLETTQASLDQKFNVSASLITEPDKALVWSNEEDLKKQIVAEMYTALMKQFDVDGYNKMLQQVLSEEGQERFTQSMLGLKLKMPHCDGGGEVVSPPESVALYPGGPLRRNFGFDLTQWISNQIMAVANNAGGGNPAVGMLASMAATSVVGIVSTVLATVIDVVPPMIPPPVWILRPFPCLPMLTGFNCLGSVLYPITIADFMIAHVTDQIMNGAINSFPAKYAQKVGKTSPAAYYTCASVYLGMYCASIFPMCWLPIGLQESQSFPVCLPQCLLTLIACPGFWLDDIKGPCSQVSVPPFCSFSAFINHALIPPPYSTYEDSHEYPQECPPYDKELDWSVDAWKETIIPDSPYKKYLNESKAITNHGAGKTIGPPLIHDVTEESSKIDEETLVIPPSCECTISLGGNTNSSEATTCPLKEKPKKERVIEIHLGPEEMINNNETKQQQQQQYRGHIIPVGP